MDIKKKIIISGQKVHDVGYCPYLLGTAESMEIERFFVDNTFSDKKQVVYALINSLRKMLILLLRLLPQNTLS